MQAYQINLSGIDPETYEWVKEQARRRGMPITSYARMILYLYVDKNKGTN